MPQEKAIGDTLLGNRIDVSPKLVVIYIYIYIYIYVCVCVCVCVCVYIYLCTKLENASQNGAWNVKEISNTEPSAICGLTVIPWRLYSFIWNITQNGLLKSFWRFGGACSQKWIHLFESVAVTMKMEAVLFSETLERSTNTQCRNPKDDQHSCSLAIMK